MTPPTLADGIAAMPPRDRALLKGLIGAALLALAVGLVAGALVALVRGGLIAVHPEIGYRLLTWHGVAVFFYWLYFAQSALLLIFAAVLTAGAGRIGGFGAAWAGFALMLAGFVLSLLGPWLGAPLLYDGSPEVAGEDRLGPGLFYLGYLLLSLGLVLIALAAIATALAPKLAGRLDVWSATSFGAVAWAGLLVVSAIAAVQAFLPAALWAFGFAAPPADPSTGWHILFHNMHYLPLMGTVLVWYVLVRDLTGIASIFGARFSKIAFAGYLVFVPPTSLYHMFLEPGLAEPVRVLGSILSLFIGVPTVAVFLVIVSSLEAHARARGARGLFGWLKVLPWRDPAMSAIGMAVVNLAFGGALAFVLIQEKLAQLLSDTFFVPGYFHFLTLGTVTLTLLAAFSRIVPALTLRPLVAPRLLAAMPYAVTAGLLLFGGAGTAAGLLGMPRRVLDVGYDGAAPGLWAMLAMLIGIGGAIMAGALAVQVILLARALLAPGRTRLWSPPPRAELAAPGGGAIRQAAWTGPLSVMLLVGAMYGVTILAFNVLRALPLTAIGGGGH